MQQTGPEKQLSNFGLPWSFDIIISFSPEPRLFKCYDHFYMQNVVIHWGNYLLIICGLQKQILNTLLEDF